ncbi:hypothetical protein ABL78_5506, partial [Leptomonas seymouri]
MATQPIGRVVPQEQWQPTQHAKVCQFQDCGDQFGFFSSKYNCHRCGIVICKTCASTTTVIPGYYNSTAVPVCPRCHQLIERLKQRGPSTPGYVVHSTTVSTTAPRTSPTPAAAASSRTKHITDDDIAALHNIIETLQNALIEEQQKTAAASTNTDPELQSLKDENEAMKDTLRLLQQQLHQQDQRSNKNQPHTTELQRRLDAATQERASLAEQHAAAQQQAEADVAA